MIRSHARSRRATPWDNEDKLTPTQQFLQKIYQKRYEERHPRLSETGEAELINSFVPDKCPHCGSQHFKKRAHTANGIQRYQCSLCGMSFLPTTNTIFDEHRVAISEWLEYCLNLIRYVSLNADSWNNRNAFTTSRYWLQKVFLTIEDIQTDTVLKDVVWLDETYYPVINADIQRKEDGTRYHGISRNKICIGVATDKKQIVSFVEGHGRPSSARTYRTFKDHIKPGSILFHDDDNTHDRLVEELKLESKTFPTRVTKGLLDRDNPLDPINDVHDKLKKFLNAHSGFNRDNIQDFINLYVFVCNPPYDPLEKVERIINLAFSRPKKLRYREYYSDKG